MTASQTASPIGDSGKDVLALQLRVIFQDFFHSRARSEEIEEQGNPDPRSPNARFTEAALRVHRNPAQHLVHHSIASRSSGYQRKKSPPTSPAGLPWLSTW